MTDPKALTRAAIILTVIATGLGRLLLGDAYRSYVRPSMFVPLLKQTCQVTVCKDPRNFSAVGCQNNGTRTTSRTS